MEQCESFSAAESAHEEGFGQLPVPSIHTLVAHTDGYRYLGKRQRTIITLGADGTPTETPQDTPKAEMPRTFTVKGYAGPPSVTERAKIRREAQVTVFAWSASTWSSSALIMTSAGGELRKSLRLGADGVYRSPLQVGNLGRHYADDCRYLTLDLENLDGSKIEDDFIAKYHHTRVPDIVLGALDAACSKIDADKNPQLKNFVTELMAAKFLVHLSSTYGMREHPSEVRCHAEWALSRLIHVKAIERIAAALNEAFIEAGLACDPSKHVIDAGIYMRGRLLFTAPIQVIVSDQLAGEEYVRAPSFNLKDRVIAREDDGLDELVTVPEALIGELGPHKHSTSKKKSGDEGAVVLSTSGTYTHALDRRQPVNEIRPGHTNEPVSRLISSIAASRVDHAESELLYWHGEVIKKIRETSTDQEQLERRLKEHADLNEWRKTYARKRTLALRDLYGIHIAAGNASSEKPSIEAARRELVATEARLIREGLDRVTVHNAKLDEIAAVWSAWAKAQEAAAEKGTADDAEDVVGGPLKTTDLEKPDVVELQAGHLTLVRPAPGTGKSHALTEALDPAVIDGHYVIVMSETVDLSEENARRWNERWGRTGKDAAPVLKGRTQPGMCTSRKYGAIAKKLEADGVSAHFACKICPNRKACEFTNQHKKLKKGKPAFLQAAHATTLLTKFAMAEKARRALIIFDENPHKVLAGEMVKELKLEHLDTLGKTEAIKCVSKGGRPLISVEADRRSILSDLRDILKKAGTDNAIPFEAIRPLNEFQQGTSRKHGIITNSRIDAHLDAIRSWRVGTDQELRELAAKYVKLVKSKKRRKLIGNRMSALAQRAKHLKQLNRALLVCKKNLVVDEISPAARGSVLGLRARREDEAVCGAAVMLQDGVPEYLREAEVIILDGTGVKERYAKRFRCDANGRRIECEGPKRRFKIGERVLHQGPTYRVKAGRQFTCVEAEAQVPREGYYLKQYVSKSYSKTKLIGGPEDQEETKRELEELARIIRIEAERLRGTRKHGCVVDGQTIDVLVVCQKPVEDQLRKLRGQLRIPSNVALRHFNKIRGTNDFKDVPCAIIVGRAKEGEAGAEDKAEALAVDDPSVIAIERLGKRNWIAAKDARKGTRRLPMTDGRIASVPCEWHPDANVRAAMSIAGEEVLQAANRIRAFDRSADNPCTVLYYGQHYSGLEAHEVLSAVDGRVDALDLMLARGVVYGGREPIRRAHKGWLPEGGRGNREAALIERRIEYLLRVAATSCDEIRHGQVNSYPCLTKNILMSDGYKLGRLENRHLYPARPRLPRHCAR